MSRRTADEALRPDEIAAILRQVDEALAQAEISELEEGMRATGRSLGLLPPVPDTSPLRPELDALRAMRAPYYLSQGSLLPRLLKRLANIPIRLTGSKQAIFNEKLAQLLDSYRRILDQLSQAAAYQAHMAAAVERQAAELAELRHELARLQGQRTRQQDPPIEHGR
jgi:hypothetical protein